MLEKLKAEAYDITIQMAQKQGEMQQLQEAYNKKQQEIQHANNQDTKKE